MKSFFYLFFVAVVFAACVFIGCSDGGGSGGSSGGGGGGGNPGGGGGGNNSSIVGTWEADYEYINDDGALIRISGQFFFNSNNTGTFWFYQNNYISASAFTWAYTNGMVFVAGTNFGNFFFPYSGGNTFTYDLTFIRTGSTSSICNNISTPTNVRITENSSGFTITWNAVSGARAYNIYYSNSPLFNDRDDIGWGEWATTTATTFSIEWDNWNSRENENYFRITAINNCGESGHSAAVSATRP